MKIYINGKIVDETEAKISVFDRGYLFGEGLFETFRSYKGHLPFLDDHLHRMEWSATFIGIPFPHPETIKRGIKEVLQANNLSDARIKILLSTLNKGMRPHVNTEDSEINLVILCEAFIPLPDKDYEEGVHLAVIHSVKNDPVPSSNIKAMNYLSKMIARKEFQEKSAFDGILVNSSGFVTETTSSNIFWYDGKKIHTPPVEAGLLPGITRNIVIKLIKENGLLFSESLIAPEELVKMPEIFLTGSTLEIMPVSEIDGEEVGESQKIIKQIKELYKSRLEQEIKG